MSAAAKPIDHVVLEYRLALPDGARRDLVPGGHLARDRQAFGRACVPISRSGARSRRCRFVQADGRTCSGLFDDFDHSRSPVGFRSRRTGARHKLTRPEFTVCSTESCPLRNLKIGRRHRRRSRRPDGGRSRWSTPACRSICTTRMPSVGRKFLLAGKGGLNITHSRAARRFRRAATARARAQSSALARARSAPDALREWAHGLGIETFVGSSGRVFPARHEGRAAAARLAASPARARRALPHAPSLAGLDRRRARCDSRRRTGDSALRTPTPSCSRSAARAGRGSAPTAPGCRWLAAARRRIAPLRAGQLRLRRRAGASTSPQRFAGHAGQAGASLRSPIGSGRSHAQGEFVVTATGIEGSLIYALSRAAARRDRRHGQRHLTLDLLPGRDAARVARELAHPRGARSMSSHICRAARAWKASRPALLREVLARADARRSGALAAAIKALAARARSRRGRSTKPSAARAACASRRSTKA